MTTRTAPKTAFAAALAAAVARVYLTSRNYAPFARDDAAAWVRDHGTLAGCPEVEPADAAAVDAILTRGETPPPPWPGAYEPSEEDRAWAAAYFAAGRPEPVRLTDFDIATVGAV